jgi:adenine deaminase
MNLMASRLANYDELLQAARGEIPADLLLTGGKILNVLTGEILPGDILVHKGFIVGLFTRNRDARERLDVSGRIAIPAFIDPHLHIESSMVLPPQYAEIVAAHGTGTIFPDPHEIVNVMGVEGFSLMTENIAGLPVRIMYDIPTCVPAKRAAESSGADIRAEQVREMARLGGSKLGELMSYEEILDRDPIMSGIVNSGWELDLPRDAHFPLFDALANVFSSLGMLQKAAVFASMLAARLPRARRLNALPFDIITRQLRQHEHRDLDAYMVALGLTADHESYGPEMQVKLDHGMRLMLSSHIFMFEMLTPLLLQGVKRLRYKDAIGLCTDDMWPDDLLELGGLAGVIRRLIRHGLDPVDAIRFATLNNAQRLAAAGLREASLIGALAPGMAADIVLVAEPLHQLQVEMVLHEGTVVAEHGKVIQPVPLPSIPPNALETIQLPAIDADSFRIPAPAGTGKGKVTTRVLSMPKPPALPFPDLVEEQVPLRDGYLDTSGYILIGAFNRYGRSGERPVMGLIKGYTLKAGALASTMAHDSHNLIVLGTNVSDMAQAANQVISTGGGMSAVRDGRLLVSLPLPVGGIMSGETVAQVAPTASAFREAIGSLGLDPKTPILPFGIFSLPAGPGAKVTDRGIWDGEQKQLVPLFA